MSVPIAVQLYTLREEAARDFAGVLERVARIGYAGVELAGLHGMAPRELRRRLDDLGLELASAHVQAPIGDARERILDEQSELGNQTLVVPFMPPDRFKSEAEIRKVADELQLSLEAARARGMELGYHNHWWEFEVAHGGKTAHELLLGALDPALFVELDVYWTRVGGRDPAQVIAQLGPRVKLLHLKDGPADGPRSKMVAVGSGKIDFDAIAAAGRAVRWHIVELDACATDMFTAVEESHRWLVQRGLSRGRN